MTIRYLILLVTILCGLKLLGSDKDIKMVEIPAGYFYMGSTGENENYDEKPVHKVIISSPFRMSATEITNTQFEEYMPEHKLLRGKHGVSFGDDEPVTNVSWYDAVGFCQWLSEKTGKKYRLPTEAEWEYACRAGTYTLFWTGDGLPGEFHKNQYVTRDFNPVDLTVGKTSPNPWGLYDMHGNVEEWCMDWYGAYPQDSVINPCGPTAGEFKITRGGSHHTPEKYLRSANRMAMLPDDKHSQTGFRIVESNVTLNPVTLYEELPINRLDVAEDKKEWDEVSDPVFLEPLVYVIEPECGSSTPFYRHNHQPAITWCDNGDLLATWFSANEENGREMVVLASRLRNGNDSWDEASLFYKVPDRNMTGTSLLNDGKGRLIHINGVEASGDWQNLAMILRESYNNGSDWSESRLIQPEHSKRHQVIAGPIITKKGYLVQMCDAGPGGNDGSAIHISTDGGKTWNDQWDGAPLPDFSVETTGSTVAGIHAGIVELNNGALMAMGRGNSITDQQGVMRMPVSISYDSGKTWTYKASPFPPLQGGQRLVLIRLKEGPLMLASFTGHPINTPIEERSMTFKSSDGAEKQGYGLFVALSYDDGETWPVKKLLTDGQKRFMNGGAWTGYFEMDDCHAEPRGYMAVTQSPDGMIHLISSRLHYRFNRAWIEE